MQVIWHVLITFPNQMVQQKRFPWTMMMEENLHLMESQSKLTFTQDLKIILYVVASLNGDKENM